MYRALAITSRHHPLAVACYAGVLALSLLYLLDVATAASLTDETSGKVALVWQISLLAGSVTALLGIAAPTHRLPTGLAMEAVGALVVGVDLGVYAAVMATSLGSQPWASITVFGAVAIGCLVRTVTATLDRRRVIRAAAAMQVTTALADPDS